MNNTPRVAIQGVAGCFHDEAARRYFEGREVETVACDTFQDMFSLLATDAEMLGVMAIENTIAGALLQNHELLRASHMQIVGEEKMRISHVLAALPGQSIDELREVHSHPIALQQCQMWTLRHPHLRPVESTDTAGSAKEIAQNGLRGVAAICGEYAAELYGLEILERSLETNKRNFTRFLVMADPAVATDLGPDEKAVDKSSIVFTLPHSTGALSKVLTIFSFYDINLSKIQSMPIVGREWEYRFYADLTFDSYTRYHQAIEAVRPLINDLRILGEYSSCKTKI